MGFASKLVAMLFSKELDEPKKGFFEDPLGFLKRTSIKIIALSMFVLSMRSFSLAKEVITLKKTIAAQEINCKK